MDSGGLALLALATAAGIAAAGGPVLFARIRPLMRNDRVRLTVTPRTAQGSLAVTLSTIGSPWSTPQARGGPADPSILEASRLPEDLSGTNVPSLTLATVAIEPSDALDPNASIEVAWEQGAIDGAAATESPIDVARADVRQRCAAAERLKKVAEAAAERLRSEQRAYDACLEQISRAEAAVDGRSIRAAKDAAQREFRRGRTQANAGGGVELAARTWLHQIDSINRETKAAASRLDLDRQAAARMLVGLERLSVDADAARIDAEAAAEACLAARERLSRLEEGEPARAEPASAPSHSTPLLRIGEGEPESIIVRLLRGDHLALVEVVARLAGPDPAEQRRWQVQLGGLIEALLARALEMGWFEFPPDHPFWGMFSPAEDRAISQSLASLGHRFDGLGGFEDDRVPAQRDLSLAVGYAGLDPMRIRRWPDQPAMADLYRDVRVLGAELVAAEAGSLSLGELGALLGQRAEPLADLWDTWGQIRPLLLATS